MTGDIPFLAIFCWTNDASPACKNYSFTRLAHFGERILNPPELIVTNADICTMDPLTPRVAALAVTNGRVSALGTDAEIAALAGPSTRVVDAGGRLVLPGFQDTHIHLQDSGYDHSKSAALHTVSTIVEFQKTLADFAATHAGPWVNGVGWYTGIFTDHNLNRRCWTPPCRTGPATSWPPTAITPA